MVTAVAERGPALRYHRNMKEIEVRPRDSLRVPMEERVLHYVGWDFTRVCRCSNPKNHWERTMAVAKKSKHLNASLILYMNRHHLNTCSIGDFVRWRRLREDQWKEQGVEVDDFHYANADKSLVCRCKRPHGHSHGTPQHPEITERCAEFFCSNRDMEEVTRTEWRSGEDDIPPPYASEAHPQSERSPQPRPRTAQKNTGLIQRGGGTQTCAQPSAPRFPMEQKRPAVQQDPEMPRQVWQNARASTWRSGNGLSSDISTPLGATFSSPTETWDARGTPSTEQCTSSSNASILSTTSTCWSEIQRNAGIPIAKRKQDIPKPRIARVDTVVDARSAQKEMQSVPIGKSQYNNHKQQPIAAGNERNAPGAEAPAFGAAAQANVDGLYETNRHVSKVCEDNSHHSNPFAYDEYLQEKKREAVGKEDEKLPSSNYDWYNPYAQIPYGFDEHDGLFSAPKAELPMTHRITELTGDVPRQQHTPTLKNLEGRQWDTASELDAKAKRRSSSTDNSPALSLLVEQMLQYAESTIHDQDEYIRRLILRAQESPALESDCQQCRQPRRPHEEEYMLTFPGCGHSLHKACLLQSFRQADQEFAKCPVCRLTLCRRTLWNRVDDDREAIFGSQVNPIQPALSVQFPHRTDTIECKSEEVAAAAQLRIIKDYVAVHTDEIMRLWEANRAQPDWFAGVVQPVVSLFVGWRPSARSHLFVCNEVFLRLIAWADLVRVINLCRVKVRQTQGEGAMFPWLGELHHKFDMAKARYEKEKKTWGIDASQFAACEKIVLHVVTLAIDSCMKQ
ncbi:hypothetical protein ACJQWK_10954 [Exserohilum turcicum]